MIPVSACLVTRGDVDMIEILASLTAAGIDDIIVWDNSQREDLAVYGRYAAIAEAKHDLIYVQDDDVIVRDPMVIVDAWMELQGSAVIDIFPPLPNPREYVVCNMPQEFRHDFYREHYLVGFGAVFHRDAPHRAFERFRVGQGADFLFHEQKWFCRTCDIVFTGLTPRVLVDVPKTNLWWAEDDTRMYRQARHSAERVRMLDLVRKVRDA